MATRDERGEFTDVDHSADPGHFVRLLDSLTALDFIRAYKERTYAALDLRPGDTALDVGCGNGDDVLALAPHVGPHGRVVGLDRSEAVIATAWQRAAGAGLPVEFRVGDIYQLPFPDDTFDGCRADRVFHHLERPRQAFAELVRVARPGARVVVLEPDFETALVDAPDRVLTRQLLNLNCDTYQHGWMGRQVPALFRAAGLAAVAVEPVTVILTDYAQADLVLALEGTATRAREQGLVAADTAADWLGQLREASAAGSFFGAISGFLVSGHKAGAHLA